MRSVCLIKLCAYIYFMNFHMFILLVEDDPDDVELMHQALIDYGVSYSIETINQGDQVLPFLETSKKFPSIIVLDLNIPKLHGREVLKKLKGSNRFSGIPVAILTTASSAAERENSLRDGADVFITKPSSVSGFKEMVASIIGAVRVTQS